MEKLCLECGTEITGQATKKFCSNRCSLRNKRKHRPTKPKPIPATDVALTARAVGDNFFLPALQDELTLLRKKPGARAALEKTLRAAITTNPIWPSHSVPGQCALLLWLLANPSAELTRFRHLHEKHPTRGEGTKPTGVGVRAYGRPGSRA
jgi:hypothetical protein